ncbi:MAG: hypothetical protein EOQ56_04305 [Mesorhizobium sp.]|nr:MAG: hypothetical protein EOQ56_04305 [Mesorhizobium sp.]
MAATNEDLARLVVQIELSQAKVEKQAAAIARAAEKSAKKIDSDFAAANTNVDKGFQRTSGSVVRSLGAQKAAAQNLGFQLNDIATQLASGTSPFRVLAQQGGQVVQILQQAGGARGAISALGGAFGGMLNPIGLATIAIGGLLALSYDYFTGTEEESEKADKALSKHADIIKKVADRWGDSLPALKAYSDELDRRAAADERIAGVQAAINHRFEDARRVLPEVRKEFSQFIDALLQSGTAASELGLANNEIDELRTAFADVEKATDAYNAALKAGGDSTKQFDTLQAALSTLLANTSVNATAALRESVLGLRDAYGLAADEAKRLRDQADGPLGGNTVGDGKTGRTAPLRDLDFARRFAGAGVVPGDTRPGTSLPKVDASVERAAQAAAKKIDQAVANQASVAVDAVSLYLGKHERADAGDINGFLKAGGVDLNAATTAWCAAFVNSALAQVGIQGSGSNVATDFAKWGVSVDPSQIQRGDVLLDSNDKSAGQIGGHVGFATGMVRFQEGILQLQMISGNSSNKVQEDWIAASDVIARRATEAFAVPADALKHLGQQSDTAKAQIEANAAAVKAQEQAYAQMGNVATTALNGIANALADGKIEGEELLQILMQVVQQVLSMPGGLGGLFGGLGGGGGGLLGGAIIPGILHKGGVAGSDGYGHGRSVSPGTFAGAKRYHQGGVAGLMPGEVPAILQRGEVVLPKGNGGGGRSEITIRVIGEEGPMFRPTIRAESQDVAVKVTQAGIGQYDKRLPGKMPGLIASAQSRRL